MRWRLRGARGAGRAEDAGLRVPGRRSGGSATGPSRAALLSPAGTQQDAGTSAAARFPGGCSGPGLGVPGLPFRAGPALQGGSGITSGPRFCVHTCGQSLPTHRRSESSILGAGVGPALLVSFVLGSHATAWQPGHQGSCTLVSEEGDAGPGPAPRRSRPTPSKATPALQPCPALQKFQFVLEEQACSYAFYQSFGARRTATVSPGLPLTPATLHQFTQYNLMEFRGRSSSRVSEDRSQPPR